MEVPKSGERLTVVAVSSDWYVKAGFLVTEPSRLKSLSFRAPKTQRGCPSMAESVATILAPSDFGTSHTLNARHSPKYFGLKKVSSPTPWSPTMCQWMQKSSGPTNMKAIMCLTCCTVPPLTSRSTPIPPTRMVPTRSALPPCTRSATSLPPHRDIYIVTFQEKISLSLIFISSFFLSPAIILISAEQ